MPEQNCGAKRRIMVVIVVGLGKSSEGFRVETILDVWTIDANQDDGPATLDGNLCVWG
jgi:hypothetical protein